MQFASVPTWATDVATPAEPPSLVTPAHGHTKTSSKNKNCEGSPNKKRYPCSYCAKDFTRDADRKRHEGCVHFGIREFHCPYVGCLSKGFVRNYDLGRHMKSCRFRQ
ncbi:hypothetical protein BX666DRAFT_1913613 [Dichotomocladium elegans]|nr:hypothetical protein BX666DRAFT_1913613 [Dichotomocladium elegans]